MGLRNVTLKDGGTTITSAGNTVALAVSPVSVQSGLQMIFSEDLPAAFRRTITFRSKPASYDAKSKTWSKQKREATISCPVDVGTSGVVQSAAIRIYLDLPASFDLAETDKLLDFAVQVIKDAGLQDFWRIGTPE